MGYSLTAVDRGYSISFCDAFTSVITGLSGLPYSLRHWELSTKCEAKHSLGHKAIAVLEALPVLGGLAALIERIVVFIYNKFFNSNPLPAKGNPTSRVTPLLPVDVGSYKALKEKQNGSTLYVTDGTGKHPETVLDFLGNGGSKQAVEIARGRALILPNTDADPIAEIASRWERMVLEEVKMSKILTRLGLLSPMSEQVSVTLTESSESVIPAYLSETFESLGETKGWFIIDMKNSFSSTWKRGKHFLFNSDSDRLDDKNWGSVIDSLLTDVAKICLHHIPAGGDSLNIAVVKKPSKATLCQYEVRYFGFDFSSKHDPLDIPEVQERPSAPSNPERATQLFDRILDNVLYWEFGDRYDYGDEKERAKLRSFKEQLVQKYNKEIVTRMSSSLVTCQ